MQVDEEGRIGNLTIKNRIVMAPMISNLGNPDGSTNNNHIAYLEERAKGGAGLIITEYTYIDRINSRGSRNQLGMYSTNLVPKLKRLTERVHGHGSRIFMQLVHAGGKASSSINGVEPMAPSAVDYIGHTPREMSGDDIENVIESFTKAARYAYQANFDGIELHGAHGYLLQEFMSPALNKRNDRFGGSFENRLRISQEIIDRIKSELDFTVGIRLSLYEDDLDGYDPDYGVRIAETLRNIDYAHFSAGRFAPPGSSASFYDSRTHILNRLPRKPGVATMVVGSVIGRQDAEAVLKKADFVSVGRAMLADPYFASKVMHDPSSIRPCIRCNQGCRDLAYGEVRCTVNPDVGHENFKRFSRFTGKVTIVGAGV
ncbi:MAG TPA: NADH:flavin oxidoreductase, partial [Thermoplasmataceae archaeon]|nr:NADH:flavin oxidoreductase [Thermoplasmataceae archaeon]